MATGGGVAGGAASAAGGGAAAAEGAGVFTSGVNCVYHPWTVGHGLQAMSPLSINQGGALGFLFEVSEDIRPDVVLWVGIGIFILYVIFAAVMILSRGKRLRLAGVIAIAYSLVVILLGGSQYWVGAFVGLVGGIISTAAGQAQARR